MIYVEWQPDIDVEPPVYMDANILVGATVRNHRLYRSCVELIGNLLAGRLPILVSPLTVEECLWAIARLSYYELTHQRRGVHFNPMVYARWCDRIFEAHGTRIAAVSSTLRDWSGAGAPVEVIPRTQSQWDRTLELTPTYMRECRLTPADAFHLALAETHARTFITADSGFAVAAERPCRGDLTILHLAS